MKIGIVTSSYPNFPDDPRGNFVHRLALELKREGHKIAVLAPQTEKTYRSHSNGISITRFPYFFPKKWQRLCGFGGMPSNIQKGWFVKAQLPPYMLALTLNTIRKFRNCDLIHVHWPLPNAFGAILAKKLFRMPFVSTIHGAEVHLAKHFQLDFVLRFTINQADASIANSHSTYEACSQICPQSRLEIIPFGADTEIFRPTADPIPNNPFKIVSVGDLIERKGFKHLIEATSLLLKESYDLRVDIVGTGPQEHKLAEMIVKLGIGNRVKLRGYLSTPELVKLYNSSHLFVLAATPDAYGNTEGLGIVILEAMACRLPVLSTETGGITDLITHQKNGILVAPGSSLDIASAIKYLITEEQVRENLASEGYNLVREKYSWKKIASQYLSLYQEVCQKSNMSRSFSQPS